MPRISPIDPKTATGRSKDLLEVVQAAFGTTPNLMRTLAQAPAALQAYLDVGKALSTGVFSTAQREQIALAIAGENHCDYCASAHTLIGRNAGLGEDELANNLRGKSGDAHVQALLTLVREIVEKRGFVSDSSLAQARMAGVSDAEILELVAEVSRNIFSNYLSHVAQTEIDFPRVEAGGSQAAAAA